MSCMKCGGTGIKADGSKCDCQLGVLTTDLPVILEIPEPYQNVYFDKSFLPKELHGSYGNALQSIIDEVSKNYTYKKNVLICAPANSGKSVFAYTIYRILLKAQVPVSNILDLNEVRKLMFDVYNQDKNGYDELIASKLAIIKLPMDLPTKWVESMTTIIDLRMRHGGYTIFMSDNTKQELIWADKSEHFNSLLGDGSYHSIACYSYFKEKEKSNEDSDLQ